MGRDYRKIKAWKLADELAVLIYKATSDFPKSEIYGLTSQIRRAAVSVAANIAEGASRRTKMDYCHFLYIARGSLAEVGYYIHLSGRLDFIDDNKCATLGKLQQETAATLYGLISYRGKMVLFRTQINADREDKKFKYKELTAKRCISFIGFIT